MGQRLSCCPGARCLLASVGVDMRVGTKRASTPSLFPGNKLCLGRQAASVHVTPVSLHPCLSILPKHPELLLGAPVPQQREEGRISLGACPLGTLPGREDPQVSLVWEIQQEKLVEGLDLRCSLPLLGLAPC